MFSWFSKPTCPCYPRAKEWVEERLAWIRAEFRNTIFGGRPLVYPTSDFFPEAYDYTEESARMLLRTVCGFMDVPYEATILRITRSSTRLWLVDHAGKYLPHAAGTFQMVYGSKLVITIDHDELATPASLIATMAHELAHARLISEGRISPRSFDNELLTDLTAFSLGFALFLANSPRNWESQNSRWPGTSLVRPEYMTPPMFGYALAHLAWFEGERKPEWGMYLHSPSRADFAQSVRFLFKVGDTTFRPKPRAISNVVSLR
jgi:hypothetical protein